MDGSSRLLLPPPRTFPAVFPWFRLDRIYQRGFAVRSARVLRGREWARLSDHSPLLAELDVYKRQLLHRILAWGLKRFVSPEANWLILRHFHLGAQILAFIAANSPVRVATTPLEPMEIDDLKDELFVKHDLNLFNFVIRLNQACLLYTSALGSRRKRASCIRPIIRL